MAIIALGIQLLASAPHKQAQGKRAAVVLANSDTVAQEGSTSLLCYAPAAAAGTSAAAQAVTTQLKPPLQRAASNHSGWKYRSEHPWIPPWPTGPCPAAGTGARRCVLSLGPPPARPPSTGRERARKKKRAAAAPPAHHASHFFSSVEIVGRTDSPPHHTSIHPTPPTIPHDLTFTPKIPLCIAAAFSPNGSQGEGERGLLRDNHGGSKGEF